MIWVSAREMMRTQPSFGDAGFFLRAWAALLDLSIASLWIPIFSALSDRLSFNVVTYFAGEALIGEGITPELVLGCITALVIALVVSFVGWFLGSSVFLALLESFTGASPGKHLVGIRVLDWSGSHPGITRALLRQSAKAVSSALLGIGFLMPLWTKRKQTLHDRIAQCFVVRVIDHAGTRAFAAVFVSALLLFVEYPKLVSTVVHTQERVRTIREAYANARPLASLAWTIVQRGMQDLEAERGNAGSDRVAPQ
ncbi:MAG: RDD family protein [Bdellovibrionota bacterium]